MSVEIIGKQHLKKFKLARCFLHQLQLKICSGFLKRSFPLTYLIVSLQKYLLNILKALDRKQGSMLLIGTKRNFQLIRYS